LSDTPGSPVTQLVITAAIDGATSLDRPWLLDQLQTMLKERERLANLDG